MNQMEKKVNQGEGNQRYDLREKEGERVNRGDIREDAVTSLRALQEMER